MPDWDEFTRCVEGSDAAVAQFLRNEGLGAFDGGEELALAAVRAVAGWWHDLDPAVRCAISFAGGALSTAAKKQLGTIVAEARNVRGRPAHRRRSRDVGLFLAVLLPGVGVGTLVSASARCL